ncbi:MAG TPA: TRC40/GET3/ArsA family transport-energizing ATPase [Dehalococcoidia bacterium]|nr:TRC40/GET3/ArsA family transport-energizing ATPase [Dehalococcoidia bacterium]
MRIILYTGKGGVGKTSVAAATALRAAQMGYRTIVLSTDPAHSLGDSFDTPLGGEPHQLAPRLWGQELDIGYVLDTYWGTIQNWIKALMAWRGIDDIVADEMAVLPGMEELSGLLYITEYHDSKEYDVIIVDCAPTGETLKLLSFPEILRWWMERLFPIERKAASILRPLVKPLVNIPIPDDEVFESAKNLFLKLDRMRAILTSPQESSVRLVVNPEKMVIKEAQRTYTYLNLYGYYTDAIICNRIIPDNVTDDYFAAWKQTQGRYFELIEESFVPLPILKVPLMDQEVVGLEMLDRVGKALFGSEDPTKTFFVGQPREIQKENGHYVLTLDLPFVAKEDISLVRNGDELVIRVGNQKRNIILPRILIGTPTEEAKFEENRLKIRFANNRSPSK